MRVIIIDDEDNCRIVLKNQIQKHCKNVSFLGEANGVKTGLKIINELQPDLVFLDIKMNDGSGFDLLNQVDKINFKLIFTTAFDNYAIKAFKYSAIDYLLKPIDYKELNQAYVRACNKNSIDQVSTSNLLQNYNTGSLNKLTLKTENNIYNIVISDIEFIEANSSYCTFNLITHEKILISKPLKEYAQILPEESFYRIHKSYLINTNCIKDILKNSNSIKMNSDLIIRISRRSKQKFLNIIAKKKN